MTVLSATILLFLVLDPLGNILLFVTALQSVPAARRKRVVARELLIAYAVLVTFLFMGQHLLQVLSISGPALTIAGGLVLFLIALRMVFPSSDHSLEERVAGEPFLVPLAIPYVAGPSALATLLLLMSREPQRWPEWLLALTLAWCSAGGSGAFSGIADCSRWRGSWGCCSWPWPSRCSSRVCGWPCGLEARQPAVLISPPRQEDEPPRHGG
jgi:multiple antibiotic resistance protein